MRTLLSLVPMLMPMLMAGQAYTMWHTGSVTDLETQPHGGVCLMGGATEHDDAMRWFLERAAGGDVLVLRASGSDGYNDYFYSELGIPVNSVRTIRFNDATASTDPAVHDHIRQAEAIWFAGGDQWNYVNYWRGTPIDSLVNQAIAERNIVIGGTSAGMAILGGTYFTAQNGTVTSAAALANPYVATMTVSSEPFLTVPWLFDVVTDSHYDSPDRRARHMVFMARTITDVGINARGIACNEYVAVCVDSSGVARVFGEWPDYEEYAYFLQANCLTPGTPEVCAPGVPVTWEHSGLAVKAYKVPGTMQGVNTFDLNDWLTGSGGAWEDWRIQQGVFSTVAGEPAVACDIGLEERSAHSPQFSLLGDGLFYVEGLNVYKSMRVYDVVGHEIPLTSTRQEHGVRFALPAFASGLFIATVLDGSGAYSWKFVLHR
ncbi:MAG TPA: cyanophycinase [Flavobacteriales bacterium]|nr:cyanophycinase [Flavobacteriales bacterium]